MYKYIYIYIHKARNRRVNSHHKMRITFGVNANHLTDSQYSWVTANQI